MLVLLLLLLFQSINIFLDKEEEGVFSLDFSMDLDTPVANNDPLNFDGTSPSLNSAPAALSESAPLSYEPFDENASSDDNSSLDETMQCTWNDINHIVTIISFYFLIP